MRGARCAESQSRMTTLMGADRKRLWGLISKRMALHIAGLSVPALLTASAFSAVPRAVISANDFPSAPQPAISHEIKVRLDTVGRSFSLSGIGLRFPVSSLRLAPGYQALRVTSESIGNGLYEWSIQDRDAGSVLHKFKARVFEIEGMSLRVNLKTVPEHLIFIPRAKHLDVVANLDLEEYVRGVLPAEMPKDWPFEALKAQAVASRTYALYRKRAREAAGASYHVESTVMDQVYKSPLQHAELEHVQKAVRETEGMVLMTLGETPVPLAAYFHADCGGHTEDARVVWGERGVGTTSCPYSARPPWRAELSPSDLEPILKTLLKRSNSSTLVHLESVGRTASGRVEGVRLAWSDGEESIISAHAFRMSVGHDRIRSTNFRFEMGDRGRVQISGHGAGHGVGLCQWGSRHLAQSGKDFREILKFYYPQSRLSSLVSF